MIHVSGYPGGELLSQPQHRRQFLSSSDTVLPADTGRKIEIHRESTRIEDPEEDHDRWCFRSVFVGEQGGMRSPGAASNFA